MLDIEKARALCEAATPLPWRVGSTETWHIFADCNNNNLMGAGLGRVLLRFNEHYPHGNDAAFIAASRTLLPEALDEIERLRALLAEARGVERGSPLGLFAMGAQAASSGAFPPGPQRREQAKELHARIDAALEAK